MIDNLGGGMCDAGLVPSNVSAYTLRHTYAMTYLKENPGDLFGLAILFVHSSLDTTRIYGEPPEEQLAAQVDGCGRTRNTRRPVVTRRVSCSLGIV